MAIIDRDQQGRSATPSLRKEDAPLLTGQGRYVDDIKLPGMLHMAFVRIAARLRDASSRSTRLRPRAVGVSSRVLTAETSSFAAGVPCASNPTGQARPARAAAAGRGHGAHAGEPVARRGRRRPLRRP